MNPKGKKFIVILILCIVTGVVFFYTQNKTVETPDEVFVAGTVETVVDNEAMYKEVQSFMQLFSSVTSIVIDTSLFQSPAFNFLKDNSVYIEKGPIGRSNPFLPIFASITKGSSNSSTKAPIIDDSTLTVGEKVAIEVVTKVADFIDNNNIVIPIFGDNRGGGNGGGGSGGGNGDNPPPPPLKRPALFDTTVKGVIDDAEAKRVIGVIKNNCNVDLNEYIDIQKDPTLPSPSYKIQGSQIAYNGDRFNNTALFALARVSEDLFDAKMLWPSEDGLVCRKTLTPEQITNVLGAYKKEWKPDYYIMDFGITLGPAERTWFHWNHMSTKQPEPLYNRSDTFLGIAKKYPHMAGVPENQIDNYTKVDLGHPDLPKIVYDTWVANGRPQFVSLFEIDGGDYHPYIDDFPLPEGLNPYEEETFKYTIQSGGTVIRKAGQKKTIGGKSYTLSEEFVNNLKTWLPFYGTNSLVLTPQYLKGYKNIEQYFKEQGVNNVRYMIYGYARYYYMPTDQNVDLSNFDVFYSSPGVRNGDRSVMERDLENWERWERTGATMIWRPNLWFRNELDPFFNFNLHNEYVSRANPDGYMITGYLPGSVPGTQSVNFYTMFRTLQGRSPSQALDDYVSAFALVNQSAVRQYISIAENTVTRKQPFTDAILNDMMNALSAGNNDPMMQFLKKGVEITLKKNEYARDELSKDALISWYTAQLQEFPGLGPVGRFTRSITKNVEVGE